MNVLWTSVAGRDAMLAALAGSGELVAPVRIGDEVVFERIDDVRRVCHGYVNALAPPKHLLLPSPEPLLAYRVAAGRPAIEANGRPEPPVTVIYGIRSCDVAGVAYLARFLEGGMFGGAVGADDAFAARRARTTMISVVCTDPGPACMCVCCEAGPALASGFDWQLTRLRHGWLVESGSERGEALGERFAPHLRAALPSEREERDRRVAACVRRFHQESPRRVQTMSAVRQLSAGRPDDAFWDEVGGRCFECGSCAFVCPTCFCFNVADLPLGCAAPPPAGEFPPAAPGGPGAAPVDGAWERVRVRDACTLAGHGRLAGGSYPRETCGDRCRIRFFHKLSWQFHQRMGRLGCTGCGRCIEACPGDIGIDRVSARLLLAMTERRGRAAARAAGAVPLPRFRPVAMQAAAPADVGSDGASGEAGKEPTMG